MRRLVLWMLALPIGGLAGRGLSDFAPTKGASQLLVMGVVALVTVFVATCVATVGDSLLPSDRQHRRSMTPSASPRP